MVPLSLTTKPRWNSQVAFLNEKVDELLPKYREVFDVIVTHDGDMQYVVDLLRDIAGK
jgi:hypothetical protein